MNSTSQVPFSSGVGDAIPIGHNGNTRKWSFQVVSSCNTVIDYHTKSRAKLVGAQLRTIAACIHVKTGRSQNIKRTGAARAVPSRSLANSQLTQMPPSQLSGTSQRSLNNPELLEACPPAKLNNHKSHAIP